MTTHTKRLITEFLGSMILVAAITGAFIVNLGTSGNLGLTGIGLITGCTMLILIYSMSHISGAHFNPAVTIGFTLLQKFPVALMIPYVIMQLLGGIVGSLLVRLTLGSVVGLEDLGNVHIASGISSLQAFGIEIFATAVFMLVVMGVATDRHHELRAVAGIPIGCAIAMLIMLTGPISGGAMNPVRALAPVIALQDWTFASGWHSDWSTMWIYILGPIIGATIGVMAYDLLRTEKAPTDKAYGMLGPIDVSK